MSGMLPRTAGNVVKGARTVAGSACLQVSTISLLIDLISQGMASGQERPGPSVAVALGSGKKYRWIGSLGHEWERA